MCKKKTSKAKYTRKYTAAYIKSTKYQYINKCW